jgi:hypothetical protein
MNKGKIRYHFQSPMKLLDAAAVTLLQRLLVDKSGNNTKLPNPTAVYWTAG